MTGYNQIKLIKRAERGRSGQQAAAAVSSELTAHEKARTLEATVKAWISEFRQIRQARYQEGKQQLGWPENGVDGQGHASASDSRLGEK